MLLLEEIHSRREGHRENLLEHAERGGAVGCRAWNCPGLKKKFFEVDSSVAVRCPALVLPLKQMVSGEALCLGSLVCFEIARFDCLPG